MLKSVSEVANIGKMQISNVVRASVPNQRSFKVMGGQFKKPPASIIPSTMNNDPEQIQSDISGFHKVTVVKTCPENQCHNRQCDSVHKEICPHKNDSAYVSELGGALTHKIPHNKEGVSLDTHDANGDKKPQFLVKEKTTVPVNPENFKENAKMTDFVQREDIANKIKNSMPANSAIALKNTSINDTPYDESI